MQWTVHVVLSVNNKDTSRSELLILAGSRLVPNLWQYLGLESVQNDLIRQKVEAIDVVLMEQDSVCSPYQEPRLRTTHVERDEFARSGWIRGRVEK